jgi:hypothetical protein
MPWAFAILTEPLYFFEDATMQFTHQAPDTTLNSQGQPSPHADHGPIEGKAAYTAPRLVRIGLAAQETGHGLSYLPDGPTGAS